MQKIVASICATEKYAYATFAQANAVLSNINYLSLAYSGTILLISDGCKKMRELENFYRNLLPSNWEVIHHAINGLDDSHKNYKTSAQLLIAKMRGASANIAKLHDADFYWSLDSDVIPKTNSLQCMLDVLQFDKGYYEVAACPYPSQGGGPFMLGFGTPKRQILPNFYKDEKIVNPKILKRIELLGKKLKKLEDEASKRVDPNWRLDERKVFFNKIRRWDKFIEDKCAPDGNIHEVTAKFGWKQRGWLDFAYPAIGKGSVVPSDWCGFGNTLCGKRALSLIDFSGYEGKGTEDLFIIWNRWYPNGIKIGGIPHCPADHIIRKNGGYVHVYTYHETDERFKGHLRQDHREWVGDENFNL